MRKSTKTEKACSSKACGKSTRKCSVKARKSSTEKD